MAETTESPMDYAQHQKTYEGFLRMAAIGTVHVLCVVLLLAIGGTSERWLLGGFWFIVATIACIVGAAVKGLDWKPGAVVLVIMLATLAMVNH